LQYLIGNHSLMKRINRTRVMNLLRINGTLSRAEMTEATGLDSKSLTNITGELLSEGWLESCGLSNPAIGRPRQLLRIRSNSGSFIGVALSPGRVVAVRCGLDGAIQAESSQDISPDAGIESLMEAVFRLIDSLIGRSGAARQIGFAAPGVIMPEGSGFLLSVNIPGFRDIPVGDMLAERYGIPVSIEDSSRSMAIAESWFGRARGVENFLLVDIDIGIGLGIYSEGRIYRGTSNSSGEMGHTVIKRDGPLCYCGNRGCLETLASGRALLEKISGIRQSGRYSSEDLNRLKEAAAVGDTEVVNLLKQAGEHIGMAVANAVNLFNPRMLIFAGPLAWEDSPLVESARRDLSVHTLSSSLRQLAVQVSSLHDGAAWGAAALALREVYEVEGVLAI
jgi:N-acetylglucosamine repressor